MAWTAPRTWILGELVTANFMNIHVRDNLIYLKVSPNFTGIPTAPTAAVDTNTTQIATTAYVIGQAYAKLASPALTGTPTAPTAAVGTTTTQLATTAFVDAEAVAKAGDTMSGLLTWGANNPNPAMRIRHLDGKSHASGDAGTLYINYSAAGCGVYIGDAGTDHPLVVFGSVTISADLNLGAANPYITSGGSYLVIPNGCFFNGGTVYITNEIQARGGIDNDIATYLSIGGGSDGGTHACATTTTPLSTAPTVSIYARPIAASFASGAVLSGSNVQWDTVVIDTSGGRIYRAGGVNERITVSEAGIYRVSAKCLNAMSAGAESDFVVERYNSAVTLQEQSYDRNDNTGSGTIYMSHTNTRTFSCAAGDFFVVVDVQNIATRTFFASNNWNNFSIERLN